MDSNPGQVHSSMLSSIAAPVSSSMVLNSDCAQEPVECEEEQYTKSNKQYNWKLWIDPKVVMIGMLMLFAVNGINLVFNTAPSYGLEQGVSKEVTAVIMSACGGAEILCRMFNGYITDRKFMPPVMQFCIFTGSCTVASFICAAMPGVTGLVIMYALMSLFGTSVLSLVPIVIIDLLGPEHVTTVSGIVSIYQAVSFIGGTFVANYLHSTYQSWSPVYYFISLTYLASTLISATYVMYTYYQKWRLKRQTGGGPGEEAHS